eukprot:5441076-Pleurochrysis_carterae.AAC.1
MLKWLGPKRWPMASGSGSRAASPCQCGAFTRPPEPQSHACAPPRALGPPCQHPGAHAGP